MIEMIKIIEIRRDGDTQMRAGLDEETIQSYAEFMRLGDHFPPIAVTHDGSDYWLTDGFHRVAAALEAGKSKIAATVWSGDKSEAQWRSYAANSTHAKERSRADLMRAIDSVLKHGNGASMSDRQIADYLKTTQRALVAGRRLHLESTGEINQSVKRHGADGRTIHTGNIGIRPAEVVAALVPQVFSINDRVLHISSGRIGTIRDINGLYPGKALVNYSAADGGHGTSHRYALDELALVNRDGATYLPEIDISAIHAPLKFLSKTKLAGFLAVHNQDFKHHLSEGVRNSLLAKGLIAEKPKFKNSWYASNFQLTQVGLDAIEKSAAYGNKLEDFAAGDEVEYFYVGTHVDPWSTVASQGVVKRVGESMITVEWKSGMKGFDPNKSSAVSPSQLRKIHKVKLTSEEVAAAFETNDAESQITTFQAGQQVITRTSQSGVVVSQSGGLVRVQEEHGGVRAHHAVDLLASDDWSISRSLESVLMETYVSESVRLIAPTLAYVLAVADGWSRDVSAVDFRARIDILTTFLNELKP